MDPALLDTPAITAMYFPGGGKQLGLDVDRRLPAILEGICMRLPPVRDTHGRPGIINDSVTRIQVGAAIRCRAGFLAVEIKS